MVSHIITGIQGQAGIEGRKIFEYNTFKNMILKLGSGIYRYFKKLIVVRFKFFYGPYKFYR